MSGAPARAVDTIDRRLIVATQSGLPLVARPYHQLAEELGIAPEEVMERLASCLLYTSVPGNERAHSGARQMKRQE